MSNIIVFQRKPGRQPTPSEGPFQLLFFTGVRYERAEPVSIVRKRKRALRAKLADKRTA
jgi:hypothetical protein